MTSSFPFWNPAHELVLASKSSSRRALLEAARIPFSVDTPEVDERAIEEGLTSEGRSGEDLSLILARAKAVDVSARRPGALCLGADQVLTLEGAVLHKPRTLDEAEAHIERLSGKTHVLSSAFAIARDGRVIGDGQDAAKLTMRPLDRARISLYARVAGAAILSSVGAYQLEALGVHLFERIEGDHTTILGLPMLKLLAWLRQEGALSL